ncbi:MAG TPA: CHASE2 domain-containing protein, partial [Telluria sp.]|nr:CHASE2 domain-containing protein [Telluria sp.]
MRPSLSNWKKILAKYGARWALGLALTTIAALYTLAFFSNDLVERQETLVADLRMRLEPAQLDPRIVIVDIDEKSLTEVGRFPWSRKLQAALVTRLTRDYHVGAIGFDISFPEPDTSSGYEVLDALAHKELKDVPGLKEQLGALKPALDYDGLFAAAIKDQPVVLG